MSCEESIKKRFLDKKKLQIVTIFNQNGGFYNVETGLVVKSPFLSDSSEV